MLNFHGVVTSLWVSNHILASLLRPRDEYVKMAIFELNGWQIFYPIGSIYGIFAYISHRNQLNVGKYTCPMDPMGIFSRMDFSTPEKTNECPLKKKTVSIGNTSANHWFSGDMLVFGGVTLDHQIILYTVHEYICKIQYLSLSRLAGYDYSISYRSLVLYIIKRIPSEVQM